MLEGCSKTKEAVSKDSAILTWSFSLVVLYFDVNHGGPCVPIGATSHFFPRDLYLWSVLCITSDIPAGFHLAVRHQISVACDIACVLIAFQSTHSDTVQEICRICQSIVRTLYLECN